MFCRLSLLIIALQLFCLVSKAQFIHFTSNEGLTDESIFTFVQDQYGFIWVGNRLGVEKYNGYKFVKEEDAKLSGLVNSLIEDQKGRIWFSGSYNGVKYYDYHTDQYYHFGVAYDDGLNTNAINQIIEDKAGRIWVASQDQGMYLYDENNSRFLQANSTQENLHFPDVKRVKSLWVDDQNKLWMGTMEGELVKYSYEDRAYEFIKGTDNTSKFSRAAILCITGDHQGTIWVATDGDGLFSYNIQSKRKKNYLKDTQKKGGIQADLVLEVYYSPSGKLWVGTDGGGLSYYDSLSETFITYLHKSDDPRSISSNTVLSVFEDKSGNLWVANNFGGINILKNQVGQFDHFNGSTNDKSNRVLSIYRDSAGNKWIGTDGEGLYYYPSEGNIKKHIDSDVGFDGAYIQTIYEDHKNRMWIGTYQYGLSILENDSKKNISLDLIENNFQFGEDVRSILQDNDYNYWIAADQGVFVLDSTLHLIHSFSNQHPDLDTKIVEPLFKDSKGRIWLGTDYGASMIDYNIHHKNDSIKKYNFQDAQNKYSIRATSFTEDRAGNIWVGTMYHGLYKVDPENDQIISFQKSLEKYFRIISSIEVDELGFIWVGTTNGLYHLNTNGVLLDRFTEVDGLPSDDFMRGGSYKDSTGMLYFGSTVGYLQFRADSLVKDDIIHQLYLTQLNVLNKKIEGGIQKPIHSAIEISDAVNLNYDESSFSFSFTSLSDLSNQLISYEYKLEPFEKDWKLAGDERMAVYTNIPPGKYHFKVKSVNDLSESQCASASIVVTIAPPFWKTTWAYIVYVLLFLMLTILSYRYILAWTSLKGRLAFEKLLREQADRIHQMKVDFFTKVSHEIRTPLTLISGSLEQLMEKEHNPSKVLNLHQTMKTNADRLIRLVNQLLELRNKETGNLKLRAVETNLRSFLTDIIFSFKPIARRKHISFTVSYQLENEILCFDPEKMEHVVYNLLSNAFKYTPDYGEVKISVTSHKAATSNFWSLIVSDTGPGIPHSDQEKVFEMFYQTNCDHHKSGTGIGLAIAKEIVELHGGHIQFKNTENGGATFELTFPIVNAQPIDSVHSDTNPLKPAYEKLILDFTHEIVNHGFAVDDNSSANENQKANGVGKAEKTVMLIVEDNAEVSAFIYDIFCAEFKVIVAEDGKLGENAALKNVPDIIISDLMMPYQDGIAMTRILKQDIRTSHIPIILLTAKTAEQSRIEGLESGAIDYLNKPFKVKELKLKVRNLLLQRSKMIDRYRKQLILQPDKAIPEESLDEKFLKDTVRHIEVNIDKSEYKVENLVEAMGMSHSVLYRKIQALTGQTLVEFINATRLKVAVNLLEQRKMTVSEVAYSTGFSDIKYFRKCFKKQYGLSPKLYIDSRK